MITIKAQKQILKKYKMTQLVIAFIVFWIPIILFAKIAGEILEREPIALDVAVLHWIHSYSNHIFDMVFLFFTTIGDVKYILPITFLILVYLLYKKQHFNSMLLLFGVSGAAISNIILKALFHRDRPAFWHSLVTETGYSFPSGHAMMSSALILCIIAMLWNTRWKWTAVILGGITVGLIGISRLYMGVHYPTDVVAGWSVSLVWVMIVLVILKGVSYKLYKE